MSTSTAPTISQQAEPEAPAFDREAAAAEALTKAGPDADLAAIRADLDRRAEAAKSKPDTKKPDSEKPAAKLAGGKRDAAGRFLKAASAAAEGNAGEGAPAGKEAAPDAPKANPAPEGLDTPEKRDQWVKARHALKRDGYTDEDIGAMSQGMVLRLGSKRAQAQSEADRAYAKRKIATPSEPDGQGKDPDPPRKGDGPGRVAPKADANEPEGKPPNDVVRAALERLTPAERKAIEAELDRSATARAALEQTLTDRMVESTRQGLAKEFSALTDPAKYAEVARKMDALDPDAESLGDPERFRELMRDAAYIVLGPGTVAALAERSRDAYDDDVGGQPEAGGRRGGSGGLSRDAYETLALEALEATGNDPVRAKRWLDERTKGG